jgi:hypothetical protein
MVGAAGDFARNRNIRCPAELGETGNRRRGKSSILYNFAHLVEDNGNESTTAMASEMAHEPSVDLRVKKQQPPFNVPFSPLGAG